MKLMILLLCCFFTCQSFSANKELFCEMEFGEHTTKFPTEPTYSEGKNYETEKQQVSHAGHTCTCEWTKTTHESEHLKATLTLPSGASISANSDGKKFQYVVETQAQVACRSALAISN